MSAPCQPYVSEEVFAECCDIESGEDTFEVRDAASSFMFYATGQQFPGSCDLFVRPCSSCVPCTSGWTPTFIDGHWFNIGPCNAVDTCRCDNANAVDLSRWDFCLIEAVFIDGVELDPTDYFVLDRKLYPRGFDWPTCQDATKPAFPDLHPGEDDYDDTWGIHLVQGVQTPAILRFATAQLACHLRQYCDECTTGCSTINEYLATDQNVPLAFQFIMPWVYSHIPVVSQAIKVLNPYGLGKARATIWSPESSRVFKER